MKRAVQFPTPLLISQTAEVPKDRRGKVRYATRILSNTRGNLPTFKTEARDSSSFVLASQGVIQCSLSLRTLSTTVWVTFWLFLALCGDTLWHVHSRVGISAWGGNPLNVARLSLFIRATTSFFSVKCRKSFEFHSDS